MVDKKTLLIFHGTRQVSPDLYLFRNFWKEKGSQVSPTRTIKVFGKFRLFLIICLAIIMIHVFC